MKCSRCEHELPPNKAKCLSCGKWNVLEADEVQPTVGEGFDVDGSIPLNRVKSEDAARIKTGPWDHMWGTTEYTDGRAPESGIAWPSGNLRP